MSSLFLTSFTQNPSSLLVLHCHRMTNAFEFMFSSIICPPGCFSLYRIKAPKGDTSYWVLILANLECCRCPSQEKSSWWRYLTTLMLKTFPKHKDAFCPQAICKTIASALFSFSDVVGLLQLFTASQNLCWFEIYMVNSALGTRQRD